MGPRPILAALVAVGLSMALAGPALAANPAISNILPRNGSHFGGTSVTIVGGHFTGATAVKFGTANAASFTVNSSTQITAVSPPGGEGTRVEVTVATPERSGGYLGFTYMKSCQEGGPAPEISSVAPTSGRAETKVRISGFRFFGSSGCGTSFSIERVFFGPTEAHFEAVNGGLELAAVAPGGTGTVDVRVEDPLGISPVTESDQFTNLPGPIYHWYQQGVLMTAGEETPTVMFGNEVNLSVGAANGGNCRTVGGGTIENPVGGGAGVGRTNSVDFYECKQSPCEGRVKEKTGLEGRLTVTTENNPAATKEPAFPGWNDALEERPVGGVPVEKIGEPFTTFKTPSPPGMLRETDACVVVSTGQVVEEEISEGEQKAEIGPVKPGNLNGNSPGAPSQVRFGGGELEARGGGRSGWGGSLKYLGYFHQETITVKP
jgi:hypothetical protein